MVDAVENLRRTLADDWMSVRQAAARLDYSTNWINQMVRRGWLESMETPSGRLVSRSSVERLAEARKSDAATDGASA